VSGGLPVEEFCDSQGNRLLPPGLAPAGESHISLSTVVADSGQSECGVPSGLADACWSRCRPDVAALSQRKAATAKRTVIDTAWSHVRWVAPPAGRCAGDL